MDQLEQLVVNTLIPCLVLVHLQVLNLVTQDNQDNQEWVLGHLNLVTQDNQEWVMVLNQEWALDLLQHLTLRGPDNQHIKMRIQGVE
jgi:hypothetical protein